MSTWLPARLLPSTVGLSVPFADVQGTELSVRVLSLNFFIMPPGLFAGTRKDERIADFWALHAKDYDVLCFQEVWGFGAPVAQIR